MANNKLETRTVDIEAVNDKGVRVDGEWLNYSKFAKNLPEFRKGQRVTLLMSGDFVMGVASGKASREPDADWPTPDDDAELERASVKYPPKNDREKLIVRQSCLKAAVDLMAGTWKEAAVQDASAPKLSDLVLTLAGKFERWVNREGE